MNQAGFHTLCNVKCCAERALPVEIASVRIPGWSVRNIRCVRDAMNDPYSAFIVKHDHAFNVPVR